MIRMTKLINKKFLKEDWGNLIAVSSEIRNLLSHRADKRFGNTSKVQIVKEPIQTIYNDYIINNLGNREKRNILAIKIRYSQDDIILLWSRDYDDMEIQITDLKFLREINDDLDRDDRFITPNTFKSESGCIKLYNGLINFLFKLSSQPEFSFIPNNKKEIINKINFQIIYQDTARIDKRASRYQQGEEKYTATVNNISTPSNKTLKSNNLSDRLKKYLENKLPKYDNINKIPLEIKNMNENYQFKLFNCVYKYYGSQMRDILNNKVGYIIFMNENRWEQGFRHYPTNIVFQIKLDNSYTLSVTNVFFSPSNDYNWKIDELQPIDKFPEYLENHKNDFD